MDDFVGSDLLIRLADWGNSEDGLTVVNLLDIYAQDPMVGAPPLTAFVKEQLPATIAATEGVFCVIGFQAGIPVALAYCYTTLSTLLCKPVVHIQSLVVLSHARGNGAGQRMLGFVEEHARQAGACHVTLEVLTSNKRAIRSYFRFGFKCKSFYQTGGFVMPLIRRL